ncbi:Ig-like domain-containing protein [Paenibacillus validus]|uniref:Ig-like domain-containing protein n=1 Tax=Paenibacillus validus TaxID=44253 RepID=UPI003D2726D1
MPPALTSITVTPATATVAVGGTQQYTATANFSDGSTQNVTNSATWLVQFPAMASFNATGLATGNAIGTTGVAAQWNGQMGFASLTVTAAPPTVTSITVTPANATINEGQTQQYQAVANLSNGTTQDVTALATWTTGSAATATINNAGLASGVTAGATTVSATWSGQTGTANLTVLPVLQSITVTPATATITAGQTQQYQATANYSNGTQQDVTATATWATGSATIATIDNAGLATGAAGGTTTVTATWNGMTGTANLTVNAPVATVTGITVTPASATIQRGQTQQYQAVASFSNGTTQDITNVSAWSTSDPTTATIDANGLANGLKAGSINVSATWSGLTGTATLAVNNPPVVTPPGGGGGGVGPALLSLEVTPAEAEIEVGDSKQFVATAKYSDNSTLTVTNFAEWTVSENSIAKIGETGLADGKKAGSVTVTAKWNGRTGTAQLTVKDKPKGSILVHYIDAEGNKLAPDTDMTDLALGDHTVSAKSIKNYRLLDQATVTVTLTREQVNRIVAFKYEPIYGAITVQHKADNGILLAEDKYFGLKMGENVVSATSFDGYTLNDAERKTVTLTTDKTDATVTFLYKKIPAPVVVEPKEDQAPAVVVEKPQPKPEPVRPVPVPKPDPKPEPTPEPKPEVQYGKVYGVVHDINGKPLPNIQVEIHSEPQVTVTNEKGEYFFEKVELGNHTVILKDATSLLELGRINVKVDDKTLEDTTQTSISLTEDVREKKVDFLLVLPEPVPQQPKTPIWPYPVAAGILLAIILFLRRKNVEVYEGEKLVKKLRVKAKPETIVEIQKALPNGSREEITVVFMKRIARRLSDREIVIQFKRTEVLRQKVDAEPQRQPIQISFRLPAGESNVVDMKKQA